MITFEHVTKTYGGRAAMNDVSIAIGAGEFLRAARTFRRRQVDGAPPRQPMIDPDSGIVRVEGADVAGLEPVALRRRLGYVIQSIGLFPHWTVGENIATVPRLLRWPRPRIAERVDELLVLVGLDPAEISHRHPSQLSGGQQQRVGVARALAGDPEVLLMDEPFGALDIVTRQTLQDEMARIQAATGKTVLMVTHDVVRGDPPCIAHRHHGRRQGRSGRRAEGDSGGAGKCIRLSGSPAAKRRASACCAYARWR